MMKSCRRFSRLASRAALAAILAARALPSAAESGREEVTRSFQKSLPLKAGQKLSVEHTNGAVRVRGRSESQVSIDARIRVSAGDRAEAEKFSSAIEIEVESSSGGISVRTRYPSEHSGLFRNISYSVDYEITMPEAAALAVRNRFGDVEIEGLKASGDVVNSNGKVSFRAGRGKQRLENSFGPV